MCYRWEWGPFVPGSISDLWTRAASSAVPGRSMPALASVPMTHCGLERLRAVGQCRGLLLGCVSGKVE